MAFIDEAEAGVDRVMIVAHDNYAKVIEGARKSKLIQPSNIEKISTEDIEVVKEVIEVQSVFVASIQEKIKSNPVIMQEIEEQAAKAVSPIISEDTPEDVKAATRQSKTNEIVEILAKQEASRLSFAEYHQHKKIDQGAPEPLFQYPLFSNLSDSAKKELENIGLVSEKKIGRAHV